MKRTFALSLLLAAPKTPLKHLKTIEGMQAPESVLPRLTLDRVQVFSIGR